MDYLNVFFPDLYFIAAVNGYGYFVTAVSFTSVGLFL